MNANVRPNDRLFSRQWHLFNQGQIGQVGNDVNVLPVWQRVTGKGIVIGVIDDGVEHRHPDLQPNYRADLSYDFDDEDRDPRPSNRFDDHGTAVAGVAAGAGNNRIGTLGVAYHASIAGLKLNSGLDRDEARALNYKNQQIHIYNASWGPDDDGQTLQKPGARAMAALRNGVRNGRGGLGSIYVWSAGNGLQSHDNVNYDGYASSRYTIAVGAIDADGRQTYYSEPGASMLVTTYSNGDRIGEGISTTDLLGDRGSGFGDYTRDFGGTSSSTPLVSGVAALMLEANPNLTWRDVQHILVETSRQNDASDSDWTENGAGYLVNHKYGFGSVDAAAAVAAASEWDTLESEISATSDKALIETDIQHGGLGLTSRLSITKDIKIESIELQFDATHRRRGNLDVTLISPNGTESVLAEQHRDGGRHYRDWTFTSVRHWGESAKGDWLVRVADRTQKSFHGSVDSLQLRVFGTRATGESSSVTDSVTGSVTGSSQDDILTGTRADDRLRGLRGNDRLSGGSGDDSLLGGQGKDMLRGGAGRDTLLGHGSADRLMGHGGHDTLTGGGGHDILAGGSGDDALMGGRGRDVLRGGSGRDRFIYSEIAEGGDRIKDFQISQDVIDLHHILTPIREDFLGSGDLFDAVVNLRQVGSHTVVSLQDEILTGDVETSPLVTLEHTAVRNLTIGNFIV